MNNIVLYKNSEVDLVFEIFKVFLFYDVLYLWLIVYKVIGYYILEIVGIFVNFI